MKTPKLLKRIALTYAEMIKAPARAARKTWNHFFQDTTKIKESGLPAVIVGGVWAATTMPFRRIVVPAALAGRIARQYDTHIGVATAGFVGGLVGFSLVAFAGEVVVVLYVLEAMILAAKADEMSQKEQEEKKRAALIKLKDIEKATRKEGPVRVGKEAEVSISDETSVSR